MNPRLKLHRRGEIALRGGILDLYPLTSAWPVRLEFFGDELESLRHFDPLTQISREEISGVSLPPAGEIGLLKRGKAPAEGWASLVDHLPSNALVLLCDPVQLAQKAEEYALQLPAGDPFYIDWNLWRQQATAKGLTLLEIAEGDFDSGPLMSSLDAFRPVPERAAEPPVAEAQRRSSSLRSIAGCARTIACICSATTKASVSGLPRSGPNTGWPRERREFRRSRRTRQRCLPRTSARWPGDFSTMTPRWWW